MTLSIALAAYNGSAFILEQLQSIYAQTRLPDEVIIVDDASSDDTVQIVKAFIDKHELKTWHIHESKKNAGYFHNFESAVNAAQGDIICLCDQDDIWDQEKLARCEQVLKENPDISVLSVGYDTIDAEGEPCEANAVRFVDRNFDGRLERLTWQSFVGCSYIRGFSISFRSELKPYIDWKDTGRLLAHDWLICLSAAALPKDALLKPRCARLHECLVHYRYHDANYSLVSARASRMVSTERRVNALRMSADAHENVLRNFVLLHTEDGKMFLDEERAHFTRKMQKQIDFERQRLRFMQTRNPLSYLMLALRPWKYRCYYKSAIGGLRVLVGDYIYTFRKGE